MKNMPQIKIQTGQGSSRRSARRATPHSSLLLERPPAPQRIVAAARVSFFAHGLRGVSMDDLAAELGMSKKTLYAHFPGKIALLEAVFHAKFHDIETDLKRIMSERDDFPKTLRRLLGCLQRHADEIQPAFLRDVRREAPELFKLAEQRRRTIIQQYFGRLLNDGKRAGIIRKDISTSVVIEILLGAWQAVLGQPRLAKLHLTPKGALVAVMTVVLEGVIARTKRGKP